MAWASLQRLSTSARLALCLGVAGLTGGCVDLPKVLGPAPVDPTSAVAQDVLAASKAKVPFPTFRQIPAVPTDVRPVTAWRASVLAMTAEKAALDRNIAATPIDQTDPELWAKRVRAQSGLDAVGPAPGASSAADAEAFAKALRERATPPPPPK